jgi:hypothetical protein
MDLNSQLYISIRNETSHCNQESIKIADNKIRLPRTSGTGIIYTDNKSFKLLKRKRKLKT